MSFKLFKSKTEFCYLLVEIGLVRKWNSIKTIWVFIVTESDLENENVNNFRMKEVYKWNDI